MGASGVIAITAIVQIVLSFFPLAIYIMFPESIQSPIQGTFSLIIGLISFFILFLLITLILGDKESSQQQKILGVILVLLLSGIGAFVYLAIKNKNKSVLNDKSRDYGGFTSKGLFSSISLKFYPPKETFDIINSPSYANVSDADKKTILFMERNNQVVKSKLGLEKKDDSNVAYYRNGKPVYRKDIKSHPKI